MTELKPAEQYQTEAVIEPDNGSAPPKPEPTIDEQSRQASMARTMIANSMAQREQACGVEINDAVQAILKKYRCTARFMQERDIASDRTTKVWLQPIALEKVQPSGQG